MEIEIDNSVKYKEIDRLELIATKHFGGNLSTLAKKMGKNYVYRSRDRLGKTVLLELKNKIIKKGGVN